jgi:hypothetical protein
MLQDTSSTSGSSSAGTAASSVENAVSSRLVRGGFVDVSAGSSVGSSAEKAVLSIPIFGGGFIDGFEEGVSVEKAESSSPEFAGGGFIDGLEE